MYFRSLILWISCMGTISCASRDYNASAVKAPPVDIVGHSFFQCTTKSKQSFDILNGNEEQQIVLLKNGKVLKTATIKAASRKGEEVITYSYDLGGGSGLIVKVGPHPSSHSIVIDGQINQCDTSENVSIPALDALVSGTASPSQDSPVGHSLFNCRVSSTLAFDILRGNLSGNLFIYTNDSGELKKIQSASRKEEEVNTFTFNFAGDERLVLTVHPHSANNTITVKGKTHKCKSSNAVSLVGLAELVKDNQ